MNVVKDSQCRTVVLSASVVQKIDRFSKKNGLSRNAFIRLACFRQLKKERECKTLDTCLTVPKRLVQN